MRSQDMINQELNEARQALSDAMANNDQEAFSKALQQMMQVQADRVLAEHAAV